MPALFDRRAEIRVNEVVIVQPEDRFSLRTKFEVFRSLKPEPNTAVLQVWNLSQERQGLFEELSNDDDLPCLISAGYVDNVHQIFAGDLRTVVTQREGQDVVTTFESGDGESAWGKARMNESLAPGTTVKAGLELIAAKLGVGLGNTAEAAAAALRRGVDPWSTGSVLSGSAATEMQRFCEAFGFEWSIQGGQLQLLEEGLPLFSAVYDLREDTGMLGAPSVDKDGILTVNTQMLADIVPGQQILVNAERIRGALFRCNECRYIGDTATDSSDWYIEIQAERL